MRTHTIIPLELTNAIDNTPRPRVPKRVGGWAKFCTVYVQPMKRPPFPERAYVSKRGNFALACPAAADLTPISVRFGVRNHTL
jgi:hypothetical protein